MNMNMNMKLYKLLVYIEGNFIEGEMDIKKQEFGSIGLSASEIRRCLNELAEQGVIYSLLTGIAPTSFYNLSWFDTHSVDDDTITAFSFKADLNKVKLKLQENKLTEKPDLDEKCYMGVCVNFNNGKIWIEGKSEKSKFISSSKMSKLWRLLLSKIGNILQYEDIAKALNLENEFSNNKIGCLQKISQTKKNLIVRIASLGKDKDQVSSWFIDNDGYGLNKPKITTR